MPARATPQLQGSIDDTYSPLHQMYNHAPAEESGSGDGFGRRRAIKGRLDTDASPRRPSVTNLPTKDSIDLQPNTTNRRKSIRDQKVPLGPRPADFSPSKSDNLRYRLSSATRPPVPPSASEPRLAARQTRLGSGHPTESFLERRKVSDSTAHSEFLPSVSFDELHSSLTTSDLKLSQFPAPGGGGVIVDDKGHHSSSESDQQRRTDSRVNLTTSGSQRASNGSLLRRPSNSSRPNPPALPISSFAQDRSENNISSRARRQSQHPPLPNINTNRAPRKSIGPGVLATDAGLRPLDRRRPSMAIDGIQTSADAGLVRGPSSSRLSTSGNVAGDRSKFLTSSRQLKAKSMQPPSNRKYLSPPSTTPDHSQSHSGATERTLGRLPQHGANTPSSSASKRTSVLQSPHATGLGARTISPTDARRLKRLSMLQDPPPIPATPPTPPTPQPDVTAAARWAAQSPSMIPRKSVTPSSTRTTPDLNRKSYSSGLSISSNTSYNSIRTSTGSLQPRPIQPNAASRLPTPKPRNVHSSAGVEEEVPPVPAIPKAYGSPRDASDPASFATRKSSLPPAVSNVDDTVTSDSPCLPSEDKSRSKADREFRQKRGLTIGAGSDLDGRVAVTPSASRKNLQPLRLPPLNLLPLSTPTVSKVAALQEHALDGDGRLTPPPRRTTARTPSTPMTASKTNFFSTSQSETEQTPSFPPARSSSSSHVPRTELGSKRVGSSSSSSGLGSDDFHLAQQTVAPSVPAFAMGSDKSQSFKGLGSVQRKQSLGQPAAEFTSEARALRLNGPRAQAPTKLVKAQQNTTSPEEPESASSGTSLRRKLSLSLRRASSKASQSSLGPDQDESPQSPRYNSMPPPKMPASATWTGSSVPSPSPSNKAITQTHARRKSSAASLTNGHDVRRTDAWNIMHSNGKVDRDVNPLPEPPDQMPPPSRTMSSILSPMHKILSSKTSLSTMKARSCDPTLDRDDMAAEEEMRKLASKRKDFEAAAKEVDDLRRRATPKERVTPAQALRRASLNIFERGEIIDYKEVFFCGTQNAKKHVGDLSSQGANFGYDDERGDYNIVNGDHLAYRYEIVDILGKGSFGQVVRCVDHKTGGLVAVKIIRNKKRFHQQALVEVNILQLLREWDPHNQHSMVNFTQSFYFRGHLCISTELLGINLYEFIKSNDFKGFTLKLIRRFTKQMLSSLVLLSGHRVIHCDLKPENILLAHPVHSEIKVIDFGSSCFENEKVYTYIQSRFYRSPEVILGTSYGMPIDMWSLGCILAELFTGYPIFPGENEQEQLACIMEVFGPPEKHLIEKSTRKKLFFDSMGKPRLTVSSKGRRRRPSSKTLQQALKCDDDAFLDFLTKCLRWDPERRMKPDEALEHEFITGTKKTTRARTQPYRAGDSPVKRFNSVQTPSTSRPLPEPPATSFKSGTAVRSRDLTAGSPSKVAPVTRRPSRVNGLGTAGALQRSSTGATLSSSLPRVAPRSASVKTELATAAASVAATSAQRR